jgi:hypothetical protein
VVRNGKFVIKRGNTTEATITPGWRTTKQAVPSCREIVSADRPKASGFNEVPRRVEHAGHRERVHGFHATSLCTYAQCPSQVDIHAMPVTPRPAALAALR